MIKVDRNQKILDVVGADFLGYKENDMLGKELEMIIPQRHKEGHHAGFNRYQSTSVKKIIGSWMQLPALSKNGEEQLVNLVLTEEKAEDNSHNIIALLK